MTEHTFHLTIASVGETLFSGDVMSATFPGSAGVFTVLANHEPLIAALQAGEVLVKIPGGDTKSFPVSAGIVECSNNRVAMLL